MTDEWYGPSRWREERELDREMRRFAWMGAVILTLATLATIATVTLELTQ